MSKKKPTESQWGVAWATMGDMRKAGIVIDQGVPDDARLTKVDGSYSYGPLAVITKRRARIQVNLSVEVEWPLP